ncbi:helix-turn-helix domain-containing protein [Pedobacter agri]|uniref:helix-turn-helix domain-containing protein n=1 Tax=Pedobacter agri TaxID=454586 RepID=UPI0029319B50|nr:helix-turn-helix transcriptional regulator [Pedobacter agri]
MDAINDFVIQKVKEFRNERNFSQATLATKLGVSNAFLGQIEDPTHRAKYNLTHINKLAVIFECSPKAFLPEKPIL